MASIRKEIMIDAGVEPAWDALRRVGEAHTLFAPVLSDAALHGDVRTVTFANGMVVRERILDVDEAHRRIAYAALEPQGMTFHHASMQLDIAGPGRCVFIWITDFMPAEAASGLQPLIDQGAEALKRNIETAGVAPRASAARQT
ncbi:MAG: SRPBCC family protein [Vicinamibacteraceae bacterium]